MTFLFKFVSSFKILLINILQNWYERQIESFVNAAVILNNNKNNYSQKQLLSTIIWNGNEWSDLKNKIDTNIFTCDNQILMILSMFEDMGLNSKTSQQCLRLLIETKIFL